MNNYDDILNNTPAEGQKEQLSKEEYAAKKHAEREAFYALSDFTATDIAADGGKFRQYLDVQANFNRYSAVNTLLVFAQMPEATRLGSFDYWKSQGGFVKPGQTGIAILEPGKEYERRDGSGTAVGYNIKRVFDISQVDARKVQAAAPPSPDERQLLRALILKAPMKISGVDELPGNLGAMTIPETGEVTVRRGMPFSDTFRSVALEIAAGLAAEANVQADTQFAAYCVSYLLSKKYGADTQAFDFAEAPTVFDGMEAQEVKSVLTQIRNVFEEVSAQMSRQLDMAQKTVRSQEAR